MGKRRRKRTAAGGGAKTITYRDSEGNSLSLRASVSQGTLRELENAGRTAAASHDDIWQRQSEMMFERLAVEWTIYDLPITKQKDLLARFRMADQTTRRWVRETIDRHLAELGGE